MDDAEAAFELMKKTISRKRKVNAETVKLPYCLADMIDAKTSGGLKKIPCCLCGKIFNSAEQLVVHSHEHDFKTNHQNECCFCGRGFHNEMSLQLHQLVAPVIDKCSSCFQAFDEPNDLVHHTCVKKSSRSQINTNLVCRLGCSKQRHFPSEEALELHLFSLHGASTDDEIASNDGMKFCLMCKGFVNAYRLSLEDHTFFRCTRRHPWVKQSIYGLYKLAKEQSLNLSMLIQLELEAQIEEWKARENLKGQSIQAGSVIKVLPFVNKEIVMKCLDSADKKYSPNEVSFVLPSSFNRASIINVNTRTETIKLFHMWNQAVELNINARNNTEDASREFGNLAASFYKAVSDRLPQLNDEKKRFKISSVKAGKTYKNMNNHDFPSESVLARLKVELGELASTEALRKPSSYDRTLLQSAGMYVRDLGSPTKSDDIIDGSIDPMDFLQMEQTEGN